MNKIIKTEKKVMKEYVRPQMLAAGIKDSASHVCGWYTQCGKQVKCRS